MNVKEYIVANKCDAGFRPNEPDAATNAPPGSKRKVAIMAERMEKGEHLYHENDRTDCTGCKPEDVI